jgi:serine/threonine protein phosphatase 1
MFGSLFNAKLKAAPSRTASIPQGLRVYAVGDIHGRSDLLDRLHELIGDDLAHAPELERHIVYLGDYVDRGLDSSGVLERLAAGPLFGLRQTLLKGNHEEMLELFLTDASAGAAWRQLGGMETLLSYRIDINGVLADQGYSGLAEELAKRMPSHHRALLSALATSASIGGYFFCHAGVRPGVSLERQQARDLLWIRDEFLNSRVDFGKIIVHGHSPKEQPDFRPNRINIDTAAYATGHLTCLVLEGDERRIIST